MFTFMDGLAHIDIIICINVNTALVFAVFVFVVVVVFQRFAVISNSVIFYNCKYEGRMFCFHINNY